ncbi:protein HGV2-like isoform X2 [Asterias rubens]|uniref:protein HGV2-like isoform X2 n=1 Tax=Asterias rubens TaxID=7604 RepID=UPI001455734E|nr:protein HGV2-like isoform X2 [Asterias rubens]
MSEAGASTSKGEVSSDVDVEAATLLSQGRRNLLVGDAPSAVQCLEEAAALLGSKYGELANECGETYYFYGWALLELSRMETGVLGNALDGVPDEEQGDSDGEAENVENPDKVPLEDEGAGPSEEKAEGGEGDEEEEEDEGEDDGDEDKAEGGEETKEEEVSNFQLSWEMLELARVIFSKQDKDNKEFKLKVAQVYLKLGELGLETGQYGQSIEDFTQCLTRQKEQLEADSRLLAETYYNLALAYSFDQKFDKAIESFEESTVVIKNRIATLKKKADNQTEKPSEEDALHDQNEMKELEALIPEIKVKIEDAKAEKTSAETAAGQAKTSASSKFDLGASSSSSSSGFAPCSSSTQAKPIAVRKAADAKPDDVSHLVHRKRKPEEQAVEESAGKKSRSEDGSGDASTPNGVNGVNGSTEKIVPNGDAKHSPEKPEIKVKQVEKTSNGTSEPAVMET